MTAQTLKFLKVMVQFSTAVRSTRKNLIGEVEEVY